MPCRPPGCTAACDHPDCPDNTRCRGNRVEVLRLRPTAPNTAALASASAAGAGSASAIAAREAKVRLVIPHHKTVSSTGEAIVVDLPPAVARLTLLYLERAWPTLVLGREDRTRLFVTASNGSPLSSASLAALLDEMQQR